MQDIKKRMGWERHPGVDFIKLKSWGKTNYTLRPTFTLKTSQKYGIKHEIALGPDFNLYEIHPRGSNSQRFFGCKTKTNYMLRPTFTPKKAPQKYDIEHEIALGPAFNLNEIHPKG